MEVSVHIEWKFHCSAEELKEDPEVLLLLALRDEKCQRHNAQAQARELRDPGQGILANDAKPDVIVQRRLLAKG
jgi:hypothetical protein